MKQGWSESRREFLARGKSKTRHGRLIKFSRAVAAFLDLLAGDEKKAVQETRTAKPMPWPHLSFRVVSQ